MKAVILIAFLVVGALAADKDPSDGLGCKTEGDFKYCEGKSDTYNKSANVAQFSGGGNQATEASGGVGLDARFRTPSQNPLMHKRYGMRSNGCDQGRGSGKCQLFADTIAPTYLTNSANQQRYILQLGPFQQLIQLAVCRGKVCGQYGFCEQNYINVQLLAWDPYLKHPELIVDTFRIPSCCQCKRGGSRPGFGGWD